MATHFKWYPSSEEVIFPWNARYSFPSQSNKAEKMTPRIPPKTGSAYAPGQVIRIEFPAQGYINPLNTTLEFDVTLFGYGTGGTVRFQNNIQSLFSRVRLLYGATPLEDIINYNQVVRMLTEFTATNQHGTMDQTSIGEGIGGIVVDADGDGLHFGMANVRQKYIQGVTTAAGTDATTPADFTGGASFGPVGSSGATPAGVTGNGTTGYTRRYQVNLALGLFTQEKLIPTKWMASQLAIEITLEQAQACIFAVEAGTGVAPTYGVGNVNLIPEILQFDASYDTVFLKGLVKTGVPLKFCSWHTYTGSTNSANINLQIQEKSRSVKALFGVQRRSVSSFTVDSGATFFDTSATGASTLQNYQYRIGGRYFPSAPVQTSPIGAAFTAGGAEAYVELSKALNIVGDYRLSSGLNASKWALQNNGAILQEYDYVYSIKSIANDTGIPLLQKIERVGLNGFCGTLASQAFCMAINLETSNGLEISGLNAEEQSDISLIANWKLAQTTGTDNTPVNVEVYTYYDAMIVLRPNNTLELIQ